MTTMNIAEAKSKLSELVARAEAGEEVVIARNGKAAVRLVAEHSPRAKRPRPIGLWDHLGLQVDDEVFFKRDLELEAAVENSRVFPAEE